MKFSFKNKLLIFDLDGVLYLNGKYNNIKFLENYNIAFCTGRGYKRAYDIISKVCDIKNKYLILNNGATIIKNNEIIYEKSIDQLQKENLKELSKYLNINHIKFINVVTSKVDGYQYYDPENIISEYDDYYECNLRFSQYDDFMNYCAENKIVKVTIVFKKQIVEDSALEKLGFVKSDDFCFCMTNKDVNKMNGIENLLSLNKYKIENCIYFGNDKNDYDVFKNNYIIKVYVYNEKVDDFLNQSCDDKVRFEELTNYLCKEAK